MVLIPKATRRTILERVFKEGVIVVKHDHNANKHNELEDIPNLHVMMVMRSLCSRAYVTEKFNWQWHYYFLTNEGIDYLRDVLHLPAQVFPSTLTKQRPSRPALSESAGDGGGGNVRQGRRQDHVLLHLVLSLEEQLSNLGESLLHSHFPEVCLLNLIAGQLATTASCTSVVLEAGTRGLDHPQSSTLHDIMASKDDLCAIGTCTVVQSVHLADTSDSLSHNRSWDLDSEVVVILLSFLASTVDERATIWGQSVHNTADLLGD